jgi:hypothetical protein
MADLHWFAEHDATEQLLSALDGGLLSLQTPVNIYSRYQALERELNVLKEKYIECSKALIAEQNRSERFQRQLLEGKVQTDSSPNLSEQEKKKPGAHGCKASKAKGVLEADSACDVYPMPYKFEGTPYKPKQSLSSDVELDGHTVSSSRLVALDPNIELSKRSAYQHKQHGLSEQVTDTLGNTDTSDPKCHTAAPENVLPKKLISEDLLQKVMMQNMKLKKALQEIVDSRGLTVQEYLVNSFY